MKDYEEVIGHPDLVRDPKNRAILNVNHEKIEAYRKRKEERKRLRAGQVDADQRLTALENDMAEIKAMLTSLTKTYK